MSVALTDDELVAVGSFTSAWSWAIPGIDESNIESAIVRGLASLSVRKLWTGAEIDQDLLTISGFAKSNRTVSSMLLDDSGELRLGSVRFMAIGGSDESWLFDGRTAVGVHSLELLGLEDVIESFLAIARSFSPKGELGDGVKLAFVSLTSGVASGIVFDGDVFELMPKGNKLAAGEMVSTLGDVERVKAALRALLLG